MRAAAFGGLPLDPVAFGELAIADPALRRGLEATLEDRLEVGAQGADVGVAVLRSAAHHLARHVTDRVRQFRRQVVGRWLWPGQHLDDQVRQIFGAIGQLPGQQVEQRDPQAVDVRATVE